MNIITVPAGLVSVTDLKDRSCKLTFETPELDNKDFVSLRDIRGTQGWLGFSLNAIQENDMPKEQAATGVKTPSQRLRAILFVLWKHETNEGKTALNFDTYYASKIEGIIAKIKLLLPDL